MKDFKVSVKVQNNVFLSLLELHGFANPNQFAKAAKLSPTTIGCIVNMKDIFNKDGSFRKIVEDAAVALRVLPDMLFPEAALSGKLTTNQKTFEADYDDLADVVQIAANPYNTLQVADAREELWSVIRGILLPREYQVVKGMLEDKLTLDACAIKIGGVSRERVRQIFAKSIRKLRRPSRAEVLKKFTEHFADHTDFSDIK